ncbi:hypothetical protein V6N13_050840 [Hibiscus sabdariffa]
MHNPNSPSWRNVEALTAVNGLYPGNQGGCPPDEEAVVDVLTALERLGSSVSSEIQPALKKGRSLEDTAIVEDTLMKPLMRGVGDLRERRRQWRVGREQCSHQHFLHSRISCWEFRGFRSRLREVWGDGISDNVQEETSERRDPTELYGPWMQVVNQRRGLRTGVQNRGTEDVTLKNDMGSRFEALEEDTTAMQMEDVGAGKGTGPGIGDKVVEIPVMENDRSSGHPRTHQGGDVVTEGGLGESSTTTVVHNRGLKSKEASSPPVAYADEDTPGWHWDAKREFHLGSAYDYLMDRIG